MEDNASVINPKDPDLEDTTWDAGKLPKVGFFIDIDVQLWKYEYSISSSPNRARQVKSHTGSCAHKNVIKSKVIGP